MSNQAIASALLLTGILSGVAGADRLKGTYRPIGPRSAAEPAPRLGPQHRILFVNRSGGTYIPGNDEDSAENRSTIAGDVSRIPPFHGNDEAWAQVIACVRDMYAPFAIDVVDVEPPMGTTYIESVVGGTWSDLKGMDPAGGVSPFRCETIEKGINYTFSADYGDDWQSICETIAQESGHTFGLEHAMLCSDPMTYLPACGLRHFQDQDVSCGEFENRACSCSSTTQNSVQHLLGVLGPSDDIPPEIAVTEPRDGQTVETGFAITAEAMDDIRIDRVQYFIDGMMFGSDDRAPYEGFGPIDLRSGQHTLEVVAVDGDENRSSETLQIMVPPACATDADCGMGRVCDVDRCLGDLGAVCDDHSECASQQCFSDLDTQGFCTVTCTTSDVCPAGYQCLQPEFGSTRCMPSPPAAGCSVSLMDVGEAGGAWLLLVLLTALLALRRRAR
jgi:MYXO-CTERM domain-containing protein